MSFWLFHTCFFKPCGDLEFSTFSYSRQDIKFLVKLSIYFDWISKYVVNYRTITTFMFYKKCHFIGKNNVKLKKLSFCLPREKN